jgi:hypothetical protein
MPWDARDTMSLRSEFVLFASQDGRTSGHSAVISTFRLPPATSGFAWTEDGAAGLADRPGRLSIRPGEPMTHYGPAAHGPLRP